MKVLICPIKKLKETVQANNMDSCAAIICSSYDPPTDKIPKIPLLSLTFHDLDREVQGRSFSDAHATAIREFIQSLDERIDTIICCCDAGYSRSPALAAALSLYFGKDDIKIWQNPKCHPNGLLFTKLCAQLKLNMPDWQVDLRLYENQKAFRDAIKNGSNHVR